MKTEAFEKLSDYKASGARREFLARLYSFRGIAFKSCSGPEKNMDESKRAYEIALGLTDPELNTQEHALLLIDLGNLVGRVSI